MLRPTLAADPDRVLAELVQTTVDEVLGSRAVKDRSNGSRSLLDRRGRALPPVPTPVREFASVVCLHTHSCYSKENLAGLNWVVELGYMRPFRGLLQRSFGLAGIPDLDYGQLGYHPPFRPDDIWRMETENARRLGVDRLLLAITDHDEVAGSLELRQQNPDHAGRIALGRGALDPIRRPRLPPRRVRPAGGRAARRSTPRCRHPPAAASLDAVFEQLASLGCLVVLNHPLITWNRAATEVPALGLLRRYGWAIAALELNGMRSSGGEPARRRAGAARRQAARRGR